MTGLASYLLALMILWYPIKTHDFTGRTEAETLARYTDIAKDLASVVTDPSEEPLFAESPGQHKGYNRVQTALIMLSWAGFESGGFAEDVDSLAKLGDGGHAMCLMQLHKPYSRYVVNRVTCFREGLRAMHDSIGMCKTGSFASRLAGYTVGRCVEEEPEAVQRMNRAVKYLRETPFLFLD